MKESTVKELQELGGFVLAGACSKRMKQVARMIRKARDYRWVGIYKVTKKEFVIMAASDDEPPASRGSRSRRARAARKRATNRGGRRPERQPLSADISYDPV